MDGDRTPPVHSTTVAEAEDPKDRRKERITPKFYKVRDVLRDEVEASRHIIPIPYRRSRSPRGEHSRS